VIEDELFALYEESARRNVRKARKAGVTFRESRDREAFAFLHRTHDANIRAVNGLPKTQAFFDAVAESVPHACWVLWIAEQASTPVAALLVFRFNRTVEYFTPAILEEARNAQPLALLVHEAMCQAARDSYRWWNWGGTWATQEGVYRFKRKWGAQDMPYYYYTRISDRRLLDRSREELLAAFPGFFVAPFDKLSTARASA
jgi:lipid II:glycine glycyltransferase (peptidoglycan interpeptide bridge formation enzyme)